MACPGQENETSSLVTRPRKFTGSQLHPHSFLIWALDPVTSLYAQLTRSKSLSLARLKMTVWWLFTQYHKTEVLSAGLRTAGSSWGQAVHSAMETEAMESGRHLNVKFWDHRQGRSEDGTREG